MSDTISLIIPVLNEEENISILTSEIQAISHQCPVSEIIFVDDGSTDKTAKTVRSLKASDPRIRLLRHSQQAGQSSALRTGIRAAKSTMIATLDGDCQNDPADIQHLYAKWIEISPQPPMMMITGQRKKRMDSRLKKFTTLAGNSIRAVILKDGVKDTGCSLKLFRREDYLALPYFNHMHRFLPALFLREHGNILLVDVGHRHRERGLSKYGFWDRLRAGISDLFGVLWLKSRASRKIEVTEE